MILTTFLLSFPPKFKYLRVVLQYILGGMQLLPGRGMLKMKLVAFVGWLLMVVALIVNSQGMIALWVRECLVLHFIWVLLGKRIHMKNPFYYTWNLQFFYKWYLVLVHYALQMHSDANDAVRCQLFSVHNFALLFSLQHIHLSMENIYVVLYSWRCITSHWGH